MDFNERIDFFPVLFTGNPDGRLDLMLQNTFLDISYKYKFLERVRRGSLV